MAKPSTTPDWDATGRIATPSTTKKDEGFAPEEQPPAQYFNWFWNLASQWIEYVKNFGTFPQVFEDVTSLKVADHGDIYYEERTCPIPLNPAIVAPNTGTVIIQNNATQLRMAGTGNPYVIFALNTDSGPNFRITEIGYTDYGAGGSSVELTLYVNNVVLATQTVVSAGSATQYTMTVPPATVDPADFDDVFTLRVEGANSSSDIHLTRLHYKCSNVP